MGNVPAPALARGLRIIEIIARKNRISFNELQIETEYNVSSLNRYLKTLLECGYINKTSDNKYVLGLKLIALTQSEFIWTPLILKSKNIIKNISEKYGVTVLLLGYSNRSFTVLNKVCDPDNITMMKIGSVKTDFINNPWGLLYLSQLSFHEQDEIINKNLNENDSILTYDSIKRVLKTACKNKCMLDNEMFTPNIIRIAVPVFGINNRVIASIGIGSFISNIKEDNTNILIDVLKDEAQKLSYVI